jgi:hypothetical protein
MTIVYILLILLQAAIIVFFIRRNKKQAARKQAAIPGVYKTFREQAIHVTPLQLKLNIPNTESLVYGVVMDWDIGETLVTLAAYITGAASMYFSTGEGKAGGGKNPVVGEAAVDFVTTAQQFLDKAVPVTTIEAPGKGMIRFYFLTNHRVYMAQEPLAMYETSEAQLFELFQKGNNVVSQMHNSGNGSASN